MSKQEFLDKLYEALCEEMDKYEALKHIEYYKEYIESKVREGKKEKDVVKSLGNPRLIAKSLIEAGDEAFKYSDDVYGEKNKYTERENQWFDSYNEGGHKKSFIVNKWIMWLILALLVLTLLLIIGSAFKIMLLIGKLIVKFFVPIVIIVGIIWIVKIMKK